MFYAIDSNYSEDWTSEDGLHIGQVFFFDRMDDLRDFVADAQEWNGNYRFRISRYEAYKIMRNFVACKGYFKGEDYITVDDLRSIYNHCLQVWWR